MVKVMETKLIDFGIDFIKILKTYESGFSDIQPLTRIIKIRKFNGENLQIQLSNKFEHIYFDQTFKIDKFLLHDFCFDYPLLQDFYSSIQDYLLVKDNIIKCEFDLTVKKGYVNARREQIFSENCEIELNHLIYKMQDIVLDENFTEQKYIGTGIKYFLYNKEQNRTITLYDHQIKFIQDNFNKT